MTIRLKPKTLPVIRETPMCDGRPRDYTRKMSVRFLECLAVIDG